MVKNVIFGGQLKYRSNCSPVYQLVQGDLCGLFGFRREVFQSFDVVLVDTSLRYCLSHPLLFLDECC